MPADAPARDATLRRLLRIAWSYRADCLQLLGLQLAVVFLTVLVIALVGVGIDFVRHCADRAAPAPALPFFVPAGASDRAVLVWLGAGILAAADIYAGLTADRADRTRFSDADAAAELRRLIDGGVLDKRTANAVLVAAGHSESLGRRAANAGGLSTREVDVLRLAAKGLSTKDIAEKLFISPKTADHHIQHVYTKIGVSTRAAAALWAMQNSIVN